MNKRIEDKITVILPYYKKKIFFTKSFNSVQNQTYKNIETIIIYDDESLKDLKFIKKKISKYKKTKLIVNSKNLGVSKSRNKGISVAKGKYIAFLDCDDLWKKNKLELQINFMKKENINFSHTGYEIINSKDRIVGRMRINEILYYDDLLKSCDIGLSTVILKKSILSKKPFPPLKTKEDYVLWLKISKKYKIKGLKKSLTQWRRLDNSLSSSIKQKIMDAFKVYYIFEKKNLLESIYLTIRLIFFAIYKKMYLQRTD
ncbi:glycosyltransferase family 2 protein [Candidatus Pelagibacter sp. Uisw_092]|uniref:glycosyltransferase family 2 protein n=1 Tax=Candidatus Pelagibacter sp. Uisw_092 TaxID=3230979 RepID=UPI0039E8F15F